MAERKECKEDENQCLELLYPLCTVRVFACLGFNEEVYGVEHVSETKQPDNIEVLGYAEFALYSGSYRSYQGYEV